MLENQNETTSQRRLRETLSTGAPVRPVPIADGAPEPDADREVLGRLYRLIKEPPLVPEVGAKAAAAVRQCVARSGEEISKVVQDHVERALALQQQAQTFVTILRESGDVLCGMIEQEAARHDRLTAVMQQTRDSLGSMALPDALPDGGERRAG